MSRKQLRTRLATEADLLFIAEVYNSTIASRMSTADTSPQPLSHWKQWFKKHKPPQKRPVLIATLGPEPVGWLSFSDFYGRQAYDGTAEVSVYVHQNHRRQGVAKGLLLEAMQMAPTLGLHTLVAYIFGHNSASMQLFKNFDFTVWGYLPAVAQMGENSYDLIIMGKKL